MITLNQATQTTISVGVPVYNGAAYIQKALDSLLSQTYTDFELIISDNASTDATESICRGYAEQDVRIKYYRQSENLGAVANFQYVLNKACGKYFMWAACDDIWSNDWIEGMLETLQKTGATMAFGKVVHIDSKGAHLDHPANNATFSYRGSALVRRMSFFLAHEALGKANVINCLYDIGMRGQLDAMLAEYSSGKAKFDYTLIYNSLQFGELVKAEHGQILKRVHAAGEGAKSEIKGSSTFIGWDNLKRILWPVLPGLLTDYFSHSGMLEKVIMIVLLPFKLFGAYIFSLKNLYLKLRRVK